MSAFRQLTQTEGWVIANGVATNSVTNQVCALRQQIDCVVNCQVGEWPNWDAVACDFTTGLKTRQRDVLVQPKNSGTACPNLSEQDDCVVNCVVSDWSQWTQCNKQTGEQARERTVTHHPLNDGIAWHPLAREIRRYLACVLRARVRVRAFTSACTACRDKICLSLGRWTSTS